MRYGKITFAFVNFGVEKWTLGDWTRLVSKKNQCIVFSLVSNH